MNNPAPLVPNQSAASLFSNSNINRVDDRHPIWRIDGFFELTDSSHDDDDEDVDDLNDHAEDNDDDDDNWRLQ